MAGRRSKPKSENSEFWLEHGIDLDNRILMLDEDVDDTTVGYIIRGLLSMERASSELPITVIINTPGGDCYAGLALYDTLRSSPCEIITIGIGKVMSMGTWIMLGGDTRKAYENTTFMWHTVASGSEGKLFDIETDVIETKRLYNKLLDIYDSRSSKSKSFWLKWLRHEDRFGDVHKAMELGFVDEIIPTLGGEK